MRVELTAVAMLKSRRERVAFQASWREGDKARTRWPTTAVQASSESRGVGDCQNAGLGGAAVWWWWQ